MSSPLATLSPVEVFLHEHKEVFSEAEDRAWIRAAQVSSAVDLHRALEFYPSQWISKEFAKRAKRFLRTSVQKTHKNKRIMADCVHTYIEIPRWIWYEVIDTEIFQRLRFIKQLGFT